MPIIFVSSNDSVLFYSIRNTQAKKIGLPCIWNHKVNDGKVLPSLINCTSAIMATIVDYRR